MPFALLSEYKCRTPHIIYGGTDMKLFITFSKRSLAAVLLALIAALAVLSRVTALSGGDIGGATNAEPGGLYEQPRLQCRGNRGFL